MLLRNHCLDEPSIQNMSVNVEIWKSSWLLILVDGISSTVNCKTMHKHMIISGLKNSCSFILYWSCQELVLMRSSVRPPHRVCTYQVLFVSSNCIYLLTKCLFERLLSETCSSKDGTLKILVLCLLSTLLTKILCIHNEWIDCIDIFAFRRCCWSIIWTLKVSWGVVFSISIQSVAKNANFTMDFTKYCQNIVS